MKVQMTAGVLGLVLAGKALAHGGITDSTVLARMGLLDRSGAETGPENAAVPEGGGT